MVEDILVKVDRASMAHSLEVRSPFLDYHLIEFAFRDVPSELKSTTNARKILLKKLAANVLPKSFDLNWIRKGPWRDFFAEVLYDQNSIFPHSTIRGLFDGLDTGRPYSELLFGLVLFELWRTEYRVAI